ncbi:MAG: MipA/OmpV family protein, partial [Sulfitobacter sp.]|nr:MipA/OmpV family protein [Sulfitobacter sp.]
MKNFLHGLLIVFLGLFVLVAFCEARNLDRKGVNAPEIWGVAMGVRSATIPFAAYKSNVNDVLPLIFHDNGRLFIDGLDCGYRLIKGESWQLSPLARYRFFDIPETYQNEVQESGMDFGWQFR